MENKIPQGKASSLSYLKNLGLNVPDWEVITHEEILSWGELSLWESVQRTKIEGSDISIAISNFANSIKLPQSISAKFQDKWTAVRSSASVEDSVDNSFAGIFETKLFVKEDIKEAIIQVWTSLYSQKALAYCLERGVPLSSLAMNVIIQDMIIGEKSGVLFQADPLGRIDHLIIIAGHGIGQGVVDEVTDIDQFIFVGSKLIKSNINKKIKYQIYNSETKSIETTPLPENLALSPVLTDQECSDLIAISKVIEKNSPLFMDIEFTIKEKKIYVLQARPITTLAPKDHLFVFDNSNIAENYPGQTLPFTFSSLQRGYASNFRNLLGFIGFPKDDRDRIDHHVNQMIGYWGGRIYYNLNHWYSIYSLLPIGGNKAAQAFNEMVGIDSNSFSKIKNRSKIKNIYIAFRTIPVFFFYSFLTIFFHARYKKDFANLHASFKPRIKESSSLFEMIRILNEMDQQYLSIIKIPLFNDFFSSILNSLCRKMLSKVAGHKADSLLNDLLSHRENLESSKAIYSLLDLASHIQQNPKLKEFIAQNLANTTFLTDLTKNALFEDFDIKLRYHLDRYGDRSQWEMKFETPTARENIKPLLKLTLDYATHNISADQHRKKEQEKSQSAQIELTQILASKKLYHLLFKLVFYKNTQAICFREDARFDRVRMKGLGRELMLKIGSELVKKEKLETAEDVFYLYYQEVISLIHDSYGGTYLKDLVELRKRHLEASSSAKLSDRIIVNELRPYSLFQTQESNEHSFLKGIPCSSGQAIAEVVVVTDLNEVPSLSGKILIAERTDPSWGYFFVGVKGIIVEKGSMLSHAAIISRELGIPCIINVSSATTRLKNGVTISMNGDTGEITVV